MHEPRRLLCLWRDRASPDRRRCHRDPGIRSVLFKVIEHVRPKLSCRTCETILQAPLPSFPIERGRAGPALLAHVVVAKYADALPLHRQTVIYERDGIDLDRSTLADWVGSMAGLIAPLANAIGQHVCAGTVLHADDTTVPVLAPGKGEPRPADCGRRARRSIVVWISTASGLLSLLPRPQGGARRSTIGDVSRLPARRWLCRLQWPL